MRQLLLLNPENASEEEIKSYRVREASRAVVVDENGMVALLYVSKENCYKLPGGGLEGIEDKKVGLKRECREEIGCDIEVIGEIGSIMEYRKSSNFKQVSYCYFAKVKGQKGVPNFTKEETEKDFKQVWLSYDSAKQALAESLATDFEIKTYRIPRDKAFLEEAKEYTRNLTIYIS